MTMNRNQIALAAVAGAVVLLWLLRKGSNTTPAAAVTATNATGLPTLSALLGSLGVTSGASSGTTTGATVAPASIDAVARNAAPTTTPVAAWGGSVTNAAAATGTPAAGASEWAGPTIANENNWGMENRQFDTGYLSAHLGI